VAATGTVSVPVNWIPKLLVRVVTERSITELVPLDTGVRASKLGSAVHVPV
jgi:hypothetical protein